MKKILFILLLLTTIANAQVKISELPNYTGTLPGTSVPIVVDGITRKIDASLFSAMKVDSVWISAGNLYVKKNGNVYNYTVTTNLSGYHLASHYDSVFLGLYAQSGYNKVQWDSAYAFTSTFSISNYFTGLDARYLKLGDTATAFYNYRIGINANTNNIAALISDSAYQASILATHTTNLSTHLSLINLLITDSAYQASLIAANTTAIAGKEPSIATGSTNYFWSWDKTWRQIAYSQISSTPNLSIYEQTANKGAANGYTPLGSDSKIPSSYMPALALNSVWTPSTQTAMLTLSSAVVGDVAIRSDSSLTYVLKASDYTKAYNWVQLLFPTAPVLSVAGMTGNVTLTTSNVSEGTNYYWTQTRFDNAFNAKSTSNLSEGTNLYFTTTRVNTQVATYTGDVTLSGTAFAIGSGKVTNTMLAGSIAASKLVGTDITTVGTITSGVWNGTAIADSYISSASTWNGKQAALSGTGFVKISGTTISYDNSTYLTGNQTITLSGVVTGSGTTAITTSIAAGAITNTMLANSAVANLSGTNTGDNAVNSLYSGLVSNATHTGDATGATVLTLATVNSNIGTFNNVTVNAKGLVTSASNTSYLTANQTITLSGDVSGSGTTAITTTIGSGKVTNAMLAGSIAASKLVGTDIATVGTITSGTWNGTAIADSYISSASTWNGKQAAYTNLTSIGILTNGTGWLYNNGSGTFSYTSPTKTTVGLGNVENTALSTWAGSSNITTVGTLSSGSIPYSLLSGTVPTWNQNTTGTASNITATTNSTLVTASALTTAAGGAFGSNAYTSTAYLALAAGSGSSLSADLFIHANSSNAYAINLIGRSGVNDATINFYANNGTTRYGFIYSTSSGLEISGIGGITFDNALSGTSASFSGGITTNGNSYQPLIVRRALNTGEVEGTYQLLNSSAAYATYAYTRVGVTSNTAGAESGYYNIITLNGGVPVVALSLASTGAATFSSDIYSGRKIYIAAYPGYGSGNADFYYNQTSGNVVFNQGINTQTNLSANGTLSVTGAATFASTLAVQGTTASTSYTTGALVVSGGVGIAGALFVNSTGNFAGYLTASGGAGTSDIRLKTNIVYNPSISILDSIDFIQYNMKDNMNRLRYGNIAQQVEKYYPDLVLTNDKGIKAIMYDDLQNIEIHELHEEVKELRKAITELQNSRR